MKIEKIDNFSGHHDCIYALADMPNSPSFFSAGSDGMVVQWNYEVPDLGTLVAKVPASVYAMAQQPDSDLLWVGQNFSGIHLIDVVQKKEIVSLNITTSAIFDLLFFEKNSWVCCGDGTVIVIDSETGIVRKHLKASHKSARCASANVLTHEIAIGYSDNFIRVFDSDSFALKYAIKAHKNSVFTIKYSPNGEILLSAGRDAQLKSWDVLQQYQELKSIPAHLLAINSIVYNPTQELVATASMDKTIKLWNADTLQLLKVIDWARYGGHRTSINKLLWKKALLSCSDDKTIALWNIHF